MSEASGASLQGQSTSIPNGSLPSGLLGTWPSHRMAALHGAAPTPFMLNYHMASTLAKSRSPSIGNSPAMHPGSMHCDGADGFTPLSLSPLLDKEALSAAPLTESHGAAASTGNVAADVSAASTGSNPALTNGQPFPEWQAPAPASRPAPPAPAAPPHAEPAARNSGPQWRSIRPDPALDRDRPGGGGGRREWWEELLCLEDLGCCAPRDARRTPRP
jgi:hypothetical protein